MPGYPPENPLIPDPVPPQQGTGFYSGVTAYGRIYSSYHGAP